MSTSLLLSTLGPLAVVLGLVLLGASLLRRWKSGGFGASRRPAPPMEIVHRLALGPKQGLALVRVGQRMYLAGTGEGVTLTALPLDAAERDTLLGATPNSVVSLDAFAPVERAAPRSSTGVRAAPAPAAPIVPMPRTASAVVPPRPTAPRQTIALDRAGDVRIAPTAAPRRDLSDVLRTALRTATTLALAATTLTAQAPAAPAAATRTAQPPAAAQLTTPAAPTAAAAAPATAAAPNGKTIVPPPGPAPLSAMKTTEQMVQRLAPQMDLRMGGTPGANDGLRLSGTVGVVIMMGLLTLLPTLLLMMTGFARILIVLQFVRQAIGAQSAPPAQLLAALALLITGFVMAPTLEEANRTALQPWLAGSMEQTEMMEKAVVPFRAFMLRQTRDKDLETFIELSGTAEPKTPDDIPLVVLASAFTTSELRTAFQMGFAVFLPFIIVDMVVSSVLMSMGMYMLPPAMIALPFKLLLFVLVDGWTLVVQSLVQSFR
ncbi:MAG: flagellar type III secretion system pore protein FliP [Gemmatimonadaceae bacterium]|nr:flagellar type III secretion system pore protein FliP [Gemmatimonadaceae bacterium]